jgi:hypothetical protein
LLRSSRGLGSAEAAGSAGFWRRRVSGLDFDGVVVSLRGLEGPVLAGFFPDALAAVRPSDADASTSTSSSGPGPLPEGALIQNQANTPRAAAAKTAAPTSHNAGGRPARRRIPAGGSGPVFIAPPPGGFVLPRVSMTMPPVDGCGPGEAGLGVAAAGAVATAGNRPVVRDPLDGGGVSAIE